MGKAYISTFSYDCEAAFNSVNGESFPILKECISYIIVDNDYKNKVMPIIYLKMKIKPSIYNKMVPQQGKAKIYLKLYRTRMKGSTSSIPKKVIYDEFDYYMTDDPNAFKKLDESGDDNGTAHKECIVGLIKIDLQKQNQKTFEGVYKNTDAMALVQAATTGMKMVIQPFDNNKKYRNFICPTISTIGQFIAYLNKDSSFYKGSYMYFMENDKTYLRSNDGSYIDAKDGDFKYIAFDVRDLTNYSALSTGMVEDPEQDAYIIYVPGTDAQISVDRVTSNLIGSIDSVSSKDGAKFNSSNVNTSVITNIGTAGSTMVTISEDQNAATNITTKIAENSNTMVITKLDMDSRVFTPNKQYLLCNYEDNPKYCGVYYMTNKKEVYLRNGDQMSCQLSITLNKCADFIKNK